jgi:hypothetical protein
LRRKKPKTEVYDFNTEKLSGPDYTDTAIANLDGDIPALELETLARIRSCCRTAAV